MDVPMEEPVPPDDETIREALEAGRISEENRRYYEERFEELNEQYAGQLIAIDDREVISSRDSTTELREIQEFFNQLRRKFGENRAKNAYITHVPGSDEVLIL
jgi:hypothetical protein